MGMFLSAAICAQIKRARSSIPIRMGSTNITSNPRGAHPPPIKRLHITGDAKMNNGSEAPMARLARISRRGMTSAWLMSVFLSYRRSGGLSATVKNRDVLRAGEESETQTALQGRELHG